MTKKTLSVAAKKAWKTRRKLKTVYKSTGLGGPTEVGSIASPTKEFIQETLKRRRKR